MSASDSVVVIGGVEVGVIEMRGIIIEMTVIVAAVAVLVTVVVAVAVLMADSGTVAVEWQ